MSFSGLFAVAIIIISLLESNAGLLGRSRSSSLTATTPVHSLARSSIADQTVYGTTTLSTVVAVSDTTGRRMQVTVDGPRPRPQGGRKRRRTSARINGPGCSGVSCKLGEVCVSKTKFRRETTSCISNDLAQLILSRNRDKTQDIIEKKYAAQMSRDSRHLNEKFQRIKARAQQFKLDRQRNLQKRLELITAAVTAVSASNETFVPDGMQTDATEKSPVDCYGKGLENIGERLLEQFKREEDAEQSGKEKHKKEKRNATKKELHEDDECICQSPVNWKFQRLDVDFDGRLADREMDALRDTGNHSITENRCLTSFVMACDRDSDAMLSEKEWCCCFSDILPPCLSAMKMIPSMLIGGQVSAVPGVFVPQCDDEGFYQPVQCDSNDGRCWCTDRNGNKIKDLSPDAHSDC